MKNKTLVLGASNKPDRYSFMAIRRLLAQGFPVHAVGSHEGQVDGTIIVTKVENLDDIDTVTIYLNCNNQLGYHNYLIGLKPRRVIFNPGAENNALKLLLEKEGVLVLYACTLVMLSTGQY